MPVKTTIPAGAAHDDRPIENFQTGQVVALWLFLRFKDIPILTDTAQRTSVLGTWREMRYVLRPLSAILFLRGFMHASITAFLPTYINQQTGNLWLAGIGLTVFETAGGSLRFKTAPGEQSRTVPRDDEQPRGEWIRLKHPNRHGINESPGGE